jgi:hypothetical protein
MKPKAALKKATCNKKYSKLLRKFNVEVDRLEEGMFSDYGYWEGAAKYGGHTNVPAGYWVYVYPDWYVFEKTTDRAASKD